MEITNVKIRPVNEPRLKGMATVVFDHDFAVSDIKIISGHKRMCLEFPKDKSLSNPRHVSCTPLNCETREYIESIVIKAYRLGCDYFLREDGDGNGTGYQPYRDRCPA